MKPKLTYKCQNPLPSKKWLWDLALLSAICYHLKLNTKLQGHQKLISNMFGAVRASEMKVKLIRKQLENVNLCHFFFLRFAHKHGTLNVHFPAVRNVQMIDSLAES
jgi:hypothetical protein